MTSYNASHTFKEEGRCECHFKYVAPVQVLSHIVKLNKLEVPVEQTYHYNLRPCCYKHCQKEKCHVAEMKAGDFFIWDRDLKSLDQTSEPKHTIKIDAHCKKDGGREAVYGYWKVEQAYDLDCCDNCKCQKI